MLLFAAAVLIAAAVQRDPILTIIGIVLLLLGGGIFTYRQITRDKDDDATAQAGIVKFQAPASLIMVVVGVVIVLVGRGALTLSVNDVVDEASSDTPGTTTATPQPFPTQEPTTTTVVATTQTTKPPSTSESTEDSDTIEGTTPPPVLDDNGEPLTELPRTGGGDLIPLGIILLAGGRWITQHGTETQHDDVERTG